MRGFELVTIGGVHLMPDQLSYLSGLFKLLH
jgi:hypothetical protein